MDDITIKKLAITDALLLHNVAVKAYSDHYLHLWYDGGEWYLKKYFSVERLTHELTDLNSAFYLAYYNNQPVGFLKLNISVESQFGDNKNVLELERIYLNKETAGKSIGKALVKLTFKVARENNKNIVCLKAMDTSDGPIAFYKAMGFEIKGTHQLKHPLMREELRGMVIMTKSL